MKRDSYTKERICYILEETFNYLIGILVGGSYLAKITSELGISDSLTAILSSFVTLGCSFQLLSAAFFRKGRVKRRLTAMFLLNQLLFLLLYVVPVFPIRQGLRTAIFVCLLLGGHFILNVALAPRTNWFMSFVDNGKRGIFTARKEAVSLVSGMLFQFIMSAMIDSFEARGELRAAFIACAAVIFMLSVGHTLSLLFTEDREVAASSQSFSKEFNALLADKNYKPLLILGALWGCACSVSTSFYGTYTIKELGFSMSLIAALSVVSAVARILASMALGKYADKHSFAKMLRLCYSAAAIAFGAAAFARPSNGYIFYTAYSILYAISQGGINSAEINLIYDYIVPEKRTIALSVRKAVYGAVGFLTTAVVTPLFHWIQNAGDRFLGMQVYAQQVLSVIACVCTVLVVMYVHRRVCKLPLVQKNN